MMKLLATALFCTSGCSLLVSVDDLSTEYGRDDGGTDAGNQDSGSGPNDANCGLPGCAASTLYEGSVEPLGIAVWERTVYWVDRKQPGLFRTPLDSPGTAVPVHALGEVSNPVDIAVDAAYVYWTDKTAVFRKPQVSSAAPTILLPLNTGVGFLAVVGTEAFATDYRTMQPGGSVLSSVKGALYSDTTSRLAGIAASGNFLLWARVNTQEIVSGPTSGMTAGATPVVKMTGRPSGIAVDDTYVYWIAEGKDVRRAPKAGGMPVTIYTSPKIFDEGDVAVDATHVYWTERLNGRVRRLAKDSR